MSPPKPCFALVALLLSALAGCAPPGTFPSLAPRPIERELAASEAQRPAPAVPDDMALPARVAVLLAEARRGAGAFDTAIAAAGAAVGRSGAAGSDGWIEAQQAVSRAEAARAPTAQALTDLDRLALDHAAGGSLSPADAERIGAALAEVQEIAGRQQDALARLRAGLSGA
jgi:hypothetical protein